MTYPTDYRYTKEHGRKGTPGWLESPTMLSSRWATSCLWSCPKPGRSSNRGRASAPLNLKAVSELYAPASGKVNASNQDLNQSPETINKDAHGAWMINLELSDPEELDALLFAEEYEAYIAEEKSH